MKMIDLRKAEHLSDLTVCVENENFKLHKLPLCAKSTYFKERFQTDSECQLEKFPGGAKTFALVADYFYDDAVNLDPFNLVNLHFGAKLLQMDGDDNLFEITKQYLRKACDDARRKRNYLSAVAVLCSAYSFDDPDATQITEDTFKALEFASYEALEENDCYSSWKSSSWSGDDLITDYLVYLPLEFAARLIKSCGLDGTNKRKLYRYVFKYLGRVLDHAVAARESSSPEPETEGPEKNLEERHHTQDAENPKDIPLMKCQPPSQVESEIRQRMETFYEKSPKLRETLAHPVEQFDALFDLIPEENPLPDIVSVPWIKEAVLLVENSSTEPRCRQKVLRLAQKSLPSFSKQEICKFTPATMCDIVTAGTSSRSEGTNAEPREELSEATQNKDGTQSEAKQSTEDTPISLPRCTNRVLIEYLKQKAEENELTTEDFFKIFGKLTIDDDDRSTHDGLIHVTLKVRQAGKKHQVVCSRPDLIEPYNRQPNYKTSFDLIGPPMERYGFSAMAHRNVGKDKCSCGRPLWPSVCDSALSSNFRYDSSSTMIPAYTSSWASTAAPRYGNEHYCMKDNRSSTYPLAYYSYNTHSYHHFHHHSCCCCCHRSGNPSFQVIFLCPIRLPTEKQSLTIFFDRMRLQEAEDFLRNTIERKLIPTPAFFIAKSGFLIRHVTS
ncbi:hypothetical protein T265_12875 [Opisthorchis viverrini]|uniref:BTB domain-containing protein n=1 Tax=Opisthorchis viverrini TaxID=6198 RepID=A0A075A1B1_OPIVI|nr:hypothetical protein T265_12875 [Opisthorchis viverrini]KER32042.1 hypothetical protein T265_12875 [Opisthorchis viverrini]